MTWTNKPTFAAGTYPNALAMERLVNQVDLLTNPPRARLRQTVAQSVATGTFTPITFDTEAFDTHGGHDTSTNTSRYTCRIAGYYQFSGKVCWSGNSTGRRASQWWLNGTVITGTQVAYAATTAADVEHVVLTLDVAMAVGDYVELAGYQDSGGSLNTIVTFDTPSMMNVRWTGAT